MALKMASTFVLALAYFAHLCSRGAAFVPATSRPSHAFPTSSLHRVQKPQLVPPSDLVVTSAGTEAEAPPINKEGSAATLKAMQNFAEKYCSITDTFFCSDIEIAATVVKGLAKHKDEYGAPLCPCRHYEDKAAEVNLAYWNCPCVPMRERKECHCMLFLTPDNPFVGQEQKISDDAFEKVNL